MKPLLFLSILSITYLLYSCDSRENKLYALVKSDKSISFKLDNETKNSVLYLNPYTDKDKREYLVLQNYSFQNRTNEFQFYDMKTKELAFKIRPDIEGPNGVGRIIGCHIQSLDSIYLTCLTEPILIRINKDLQIKEKVSYEKTTDSIPLSEFCFTTSSHKLATVIGKTMYIYSSPNRWVDKDPVTVTLNLETKEIKALPFIYPDYPGSDVKLKKYGLEDSFSRCYDGQRFLYSFLYDENIYVANPAHDSIRKVPIKSKFFDKIQLPDELTAQAIDFCQNAMYGNLLYDSYRDVYYRVTYPTAEIEKEVKPIELIEYGRKNFSIIILDKDLKIIGETLFPDYTYNSKQMLVLADGLYISDSHFMNPQFSDDLLSFVRFDLATQ